jgi:glutamate-5-semialdehyde dehydrogenase
MKQRPNGLIIGKRRVPIGVVGMIFEARPNVTADAFGLCFKTGNCVILKGGKEAIHSNIAIVAALKQALVKNHVNEHAVNLIEDTDRETTNRFMKMDEYVDVLIPRGGAGLIRTVVNNATIPVIETGTGNCHVYVDKNADFDMAINIIINAKTTRVGVCNACESVVVHSGIAEQFLPLLYEALSEKKVQMRCDERALAIIGSDKPYAEAATEEDWGKEYLDYILSVKIVDTIDEAISHINRYSTSHSETIVTHEYDDAQKFLNEIDSACVYVNASTRFSDGNEFGFGAEIGISTQKLHARGPMGLEALTSYKYIIYGDGQIRK